MVRARRAGHDEGRVAAPLAERSRCRDRRLDALAARQASREHEERVGAIEVQALGEARALCREAQRSRDVDAVRDDADPLARETGELRELPRALLGDRDVAHAGKGAREEVPRLAGMALRGVLLVAPGEIVRPRDEGTRPLASEAREGDGEGGVLVERERVVHDDAVHLREDRP